MNKRNFVKSGFKAIAMAFGGYFIHTPVEAKEHEKIDKVKMLTSEGKLVWVDKAVLDSTLKTPAISNRSLRSWLKSKKHE